MLDFFSETYTACIIIYFQMRKINNNPIGTRIQKFEFEDEKKYIERLNAGPMVIYGFDMS